MSPKETVYPSTSELMPGLLMARIPEALARDIKERYRTLGGKYLTDNHHSDGRLINGCMFNNSIQEALEEVVDAVFNILVLIFKYTTRDSNIPDYSYSCLSGLIEIYSILYTQRHIDRVA